MSIKLRGKVYHYDFSIGGQRYRDTTHQTDKAAAKRVEAEARERAKLGQVLKDVTLEDAADSWFTFKHANAKDAHTTATRIEQLLGLIDRRLLVGTIDGTVVLDAINRRRVQITRQGKPPTNSTVNRDIVCILRPILRHARFNLKQPCRDIDWSALWLKEPKARVRRFTDDELAAYFAKLPQKYHAIARFYQRYGLRLREGFFPLAAIDTAIWEVTIRGPRRKNGLPHIVPLLEEDAAEMAARLGRARAARLDTVWFWETKKHGGLREIGWRGFQKASKLAMVAAGIEDGRPAHDFRHHAASTLLRRHRNLKVVQVLLGHENIQSTVRYAHADTADLRDGLRHAYGANGPTPPENPPADQTVIPLGKRMI